MIPMETILPGVFALMDRLLPFAFAEPAFMKRALLSLLLTAPAAAALGVPLVQHRMAFFSDAIGHSAFTGVALGVLFGVSPSWTMAAFGVVVAVAITLVKGRTELSSDTVIGVFFSTVIALGIAIISREKGLTRNLQAFLYGSMEYWTTPPAQGLSDLYFGIETKPLEKLKADLTFHKFDLAKRPAVGNKDLGSELDLTVNYDVFPEFSVQGGYSTYFLTDAVKTAKKITTKVDTPTWAYVMLTFKPAFLNVK